MAFNNSVPYTIDGTIDTGTNLITFIVSEYGFNRATNKYDQLQWTEQFSIPAGLVGYKRNTNLVFIVTDTDQDQFSITQGWYDVQANVHYTTISAVLDVFVDTLVAQQTGGGLMTGAQIVTAINTEFGSSVWQGGDTTLYTGISEADAITLAGSTGFEGGVVYRITLDGTSGGASAGDYLYGTSSAGGRLVGFQYFKSSTSTYTQPKCEFTTGGLTFIQSDQDAERVSTAQYDGANTFNISTVLMYGRHRIAIAVDKTIDTISGTPFHGQQITFIITGGTGNTMDFQGGGSFSINDVLGAALILDNGTDFITFRYDENSTLWVETARKQTP